MTTPPYRTACPHCGRETETATDGKTCMECRGDKTRPEGETPREHPAWGCLDVALGCFTRTILLALALAFARRVAR